MKKKVYRSGTAVLIAELEHTEDREQREKIWQSIRTKAEQEKLDVMVERDEDDNITYAAITGADRNVLVYEVLYARRDEMKARGVKNGQFARKLYGRSAQQIGNIVNGAKCPRDVFLTAILLMVRPYNWEDADHALMQVGLPGLFTETYLEQENRRNYVIGQLLDYIHSLDRDQTDIEWLQLAKDMLDHLGLAALPGDAGCGDDLSDEERQLADKWWADSGKECVTSDYTVLRRELYQRYLDLGKESEENSFCQKNKQTLKDLFEAEYHKEGKRGSHGSRESILKIAVAISCSVEETNTLMIEANHATLYPLNEDDQVYFDGLIENQIRDRFDHTVKVFTPGSLSQKIDTDPDAGTACFVLGEEPGCEN